MPDVRGLDAWERRCVSLQMVQFHRYPLSHQDRRAVRRPRQASTKAVLTIELGVVMLEVAVVAVHAPLSEKVSANLRTVLVQAELQPV